MMITKNLSDTEEREEEEERWRIYILEILIAMFDRCEVEHMLFFILSNVCHRLSNACPIFAIVSSLDDVRALDGVLSIAPELSMTPSPSDEQNIRHTEFVIFDNFFFNDLIFNKRNNYYSFSAYFLRLAREKCCWNMWLLYWKHFENNWSILQKWKIDRLVHEMRKRNRTASELIDLHFQFQL